MSTVRVHTLSADLEQRTPQAFEVDNLAQWLLERYRKAPRGSVLVFAGEPSADTECDPAAILRQAAPAYTVLECPGAPAAAFLAEYGAQIMMMVVSTALNYMMTPNAVQENRTQESPNNQLSNRENRVRAMERVEDIFGTVRSIPTVIMQPYNKYVANQKVECALYCVGRGYHEIPADELKDGDTAIQSITNASAAVYAPFTSPNSGDAPQLQIGDPIIDKVMNVSRSSAVDGVVLKAVNQLQLANGHPAYLYGPGIGDIFVPSSANDIIWQPPSSRVPNYDAVAEVGQTFTFSMATVTVMRGGDPAYGFTVDGPTKTYTSLTTGFFRGVVDGSTVNISGFADPANTGAHVIVSHTGETLTVAEALVTEGIASGQSFAIDINYSAMRTLAAVENGYVVLSGPPQFSPVDYPMGGPYGTFGSVGTVIDQVVANGLSEWTDWVYLSSDPNRTEVWTNVKALNGIYKDDGGKLTATVEYEVQIEQVDALGTPLGVVETITGSLSGSTSREVAETLEQTTGWTGPARVRARRTTPFDYDFGGLVIDEITWVDLYGVSPVDKLHFGNVTLIHTVTPANARTAAISRRELNCLASRLLPTYDGASFSAVLNADGSLASGTLNPTSKAIDILAAITIDPAIGHRQITELDLAQVWAVQQALDAWHPEAGVFNYTFDSDSISFEETVNTIAAAVFCKAYRQNGQIRLALDRPQAASTALYTHRNKRPASRGFGCEEVLTRTFANDSEWDGVELAYQDPDTEMQETIRLPLDGSATRYKKVEVPGIRSFAQAWLRANREYYRLRNQRLSIETEATGDARALLPNTRIDIVDNTRFKTQAGEVVAQDGLTLTLSESVTFLPSTPHSIVLMRRDGGTQSIAVSAVAGDNRKVLLAAPPAEAIVTTPSADTGIRTIFSFAADTARAAMAYLVEELRPTEGGKYMRIVARNYSDAYYTADELAIPARDSVIND